MDDLAGGNGTPPPEKEAQFLRDQDEIERIASAMVRGRSL
jgi:hypothetical protein